MTRVEPVSTFFARVRRLLGGDDVVVVSGLRTCFDDPAAATSDPFLVVELRGDAREWRERTLVLENIDVDSLFVISYIDEQRRDGSREVATVKRLVMRDVRARRTVYKNVEFDDVVGCVAERDAS